MNKDQLDGLIALKTVAEKRNFRAAADELNITPSAISQSIKQLESRFGVALLTRTTRSTRLTEAGSRFLDQAGPAIDQILTAIANVGAYAQEPSGTLRLNMPRMLYPSYLAPSIASFIKKYPKVTVDLFFEDQTSNIFENGFDAGIRLSDILAKDVVATKLFGPIRFVVVASPKYLEKTERPKHPQDLLTHNCLRPRLGTYLYDRWEFEDKGKEFQVHVKGNLIFNDSLLMLQAAADGLGLAYTTEEAAQEKIKTKKLEIVLEKYITSSEGFYLYYPRKSQVLPKLRAFIEHIKKELHHG
ncbi:MAG: LysR substrate-binding domain-containing protein [Bdellovibrio sp.]